tara:strand:+ start:44 stop:991 length:948 start_codon:yes stop_codon:yes gene_type:complete
MKRKAIIFGIKGTFLTRKERKLIKEDKPWGIILFSRNISTIEQLKNLISDIRNEIKDKKFPILIDQEGGSVSRLNKIIDFSLFSQEFFADLYRKKKKNFVNYYKIYIDSVCNIFNEVGININTVPVLDVKRKTKPPIIGNRSFSRDPKIVTEIGKICINLYKNNKIATVVKHIPGYGLSKKDSHLYLPVVKNKKEELLKKDFKPFSDCSSLFAMTAHVIYSMYDPINTATHSKKIINDIIRGHIGFNGILISDDISMKALKYNLEKNAIKALEAGCNLVLHCNGNIKEMKKLAKIIPTIDKLTQKKTSHFYSFIG